MRWSTPGLVWQRGEQPNSTYTFKHALIQDAAYESLLKSERKLFHRRAAEALLLHFPEMSDSEPEVHRAPLQRRRRSREGGAALAESRARKPGSARPRRKRSRI